MADDSRRRWTDDRLDDLANKVDGVEDTAEALGRLPERVAEVYATVKARGETIELLSSDFREFRRDVTRRFDSIDADHQRARKDFEHSRTFGAKVKDTMAVLGPIIVALIALAGVLYAANVGGHP
jgi:hypothetical protein